MKQLLILAVLPLLLVACGSDPKKQAKAETDPSVGMQETPADAPEPAKPVTVKPAKEPISHDAKPNRAAEDELLSMILDLPEVRKMDTEIRKKSDGKRGLKTFISGRPSDDEEYYTVSVAEDNGSSFATYYTFHVYPDRSVMYYDVVEDRELTLKAWKKTL